MVFRVLPVSWMVAPAAAVVVALVLVAHLAYVKYQVRVQPRLQSRIPLV